MVSPSPPPTSSTAREEGEAEEQARSSRTASKENAETSPSDFTVGGGEDEGKNMAAYLPSPTAALSLLPAAVPRPQPSEVVIASHALAIQPLDAKMHNAAYAGAGGIKSYPAILGTNVAGVVTAVGSAVTRVKVGDRVVGDTAAYMRGDWRMGGWQKMVVCEESTVAEIGDTPFDRAVLLGFPLQTAVAALTEYLGMGKPGSSSGEDAADDKVLIWGGGGAVGTCAVQYAKSVGHTVIVTASPRDTTRQHALGASTVLDYTSPSIVDELRAHGPYRYILNAAGTPDSHFALAALLYPPGGSYASLLPAQNLPETVKAVYTSFSMSVQKEEHEAFREWWYGTYFPRVLAAGEMQTPRGRRWEGGLKALQAASRAVFEGSVREKVVIDPSED